MPRGSNLTRAGYARITRRLAQLLAESVKGIDDDDDEVYEVLDEVPRGERLNQRRDRGRQAEKKGKNESS